MNAQSCMMYHGLRSLVENMEALVHWKKGHVRGGHSGQRGALGSYALVSKYLFTRASGSSLRPSVLGERAVALRASWSSSRLCFRGLGGRLNLQRSAGNERLVDES